MGKVDKYHYYNDENLIDLLWMLFYRLGKVPSGRDCNLKNGTPSEPYFKKRFGKSFPDIIKLSGLDKEKTYYQEIDTNDAIEGLRRFSLSLGRFPNSNDFKQLKNKKHRCPSSVYFIDHFGSIDNACDLTGLDLSKSTMLDRSNKISNSLSFIKDFFECNGRIPTVIEYDKNREKGKTYAYSKITYNTNKTYLEVVKLAIGKTFERKSIAGGVYLDDLGNICNSNSELTISNFLISRSVEFRKEVRYSDILTNRPLDNRRCDFYINDNIIVEYFGMYKAMSNYRITKDYNKKTKNKINDLYKDGLIDRCIFIFPWDLKNRKLEDVFSKVLKEE